jgi:peptide deformylase
MIYPIVVYGHPVLRKVAAPIDKDYPGLDLLISDLFETMYYSEGLGLAAPQIGKSVRMFVIDGKPAAEDEPTLADFKKVFINPKITEKSGEFMPMNEGCLSIPNLREEVIRESRIRITYNDENWAFHDEVYEGYKARIIQHEYDHLDGIMFTDKINPLRKRLISSKLLAISKGKFEASYKTILPGQKIMPATSPKGTHPKSAVQGPDPSKVTK